MKTDLTYGLHAVRALLDRSPIDVLEIWILNTREDEPILDICERSKTFGIHIEKVTRKTLERLAGSGTHQGVVARYRPCVLDAAKDMNALLRNVDESTLILMLDGIADPHNLGACLRNADAAAVTGVVIPRSRGVGLTPSAKKVASGAAESVPLVTVANLVRAIEIAQQAGVEVVGTTHDAPEGIYECDLRGPRAFVLGGEEKGLRRLTREKCDRLLKIPMRGVLNSLNVASASAVILFEARRQQQAARSIA